MRTIVQRNYSIEITDEQSATLKEREIRDEDVGILLGEKTVLTAPWQGMFLVIEPDGHAHS